MPNVSTSDTGSKTAGLGLVSRTLAAIRVGFSRRDAKLAFAAATLGYLAVYLFTVGDLRPTGTGGFSLVIASDLSRAVQATGFGRFEPIAILTAGPITYLFSPVNMLIAGVLAILVGVNLALTYLGLVQPKACGLEASSGVFAGIPALLGGAACCGPTILLILGIQASSALITGFQFLIPVAVLMLLGSLLLIGRQVDPALL